MTDLYGVLEETQETQLVPVPHPVDHLSPLGLLERPVSGPSITEAGADPAGTNGGSRSGSSGMAALE